MRINFVCALLAVLMPAQCIAGLSSLESLISIPTSAKYNYAVNTAKDAVLKQSGLSNCYRDHVKNIIFSYRKTVLNIIEDYSGLNSNIVTSTAGIAYTVLVTRSIDFTVKNTNYIKYNVLLKPQSVFTGISLSF